LGVYLSDHRHRERAAFILCDELAEMALKVRALEEDHQFNTRCAFFRLCQSPGVELDPNDGLGRKLLNHRTTRNQLQHGSAAATVDRGHCAQGIIDTIEAIDHCWPAASGSYEAWMTSAVRIVRLYSPMGAHHLQQRFEDEMREHMWEAEVVPKPNEVAIRPGYTGFWYLAVRDYPTAVEELLNKVGVPA
jgi:hypothetical protein